MVLSNKKLKQKLRATIAESLTTSVNEAATIKVELDAESQQLKEILNSVKQKHKLKKKEKQQQNQKQKASSEDASDLKEGAEVDEAETKVTKRKRESIDDDENNDKKKNKKKKKKEKRQNQKEIASSEDASHVKEEAMVDETEKKIKKRKRESIGDDENNCKKKNKKKKKKKKKKSKKKVKTEEENDEVVNGVVIDALQNVCKTTEVDPIKVYVGGIPYYSTEDDIRSFFDSCGTIVEIDCMTFPETGKFRGIAILTFKTEAAAKRALALDGSDMGGLYLKIQPYKSTRASVTSDFKPKLVEGYNKIYVGNLSWDITEDDLKKFFKDCKISSIRFGEDKETGDFKGYAHVDFSDSLSLNMALKLDQKIVCERPAKISCAVPLKGAKVQHSKTVLTEKVAHSTLPDPDNEVTDNTVLAPGSGKMKRRTCYVCGLRGHISSACPNDRTAVGAESGAVFLEGAKVQHSETGLTEQVAPSTATAQDKEVAPSTVPAPDNEVAISTALAPSSGKIKRRTCYVCGLRGHISSACPNDQTADAAESGAVCLEGAKVQHSEGVLTEKVAHSTATAPDKEVAPSTAPAPDKEVAISTVLAPSSGKIKRRTCYVCGQRGHISSACPNNQTAASADCVAS